MNAILIAQEFRPSTKAYVFSFPRRRDCKLNHLLIVYSYDKEVFGIEMDGVEHTVKLIDTAGQEEYERVRKLFYNEANCFILCYDVSNRDSFNNILSKWLPELKGIDRWPIPIVLVGKTFFNFEAR